MTGSQQSTVESTSEQQTTTAELESPMTTETTTETVKQTTSTSVTEDETNTATDENERSVSVAESPSCCSECGSESITVSDKHAETSCDDCGAIIEERTFPKTAGWKRHSSKTHERDTSVTANDDSGISMSPLGGTIDWKDMDGYGSSLSSKKRSRMHRLRQLDRSLDTGEAETSNYKYALGEINRIAAAITAPRHVRDAASELYERILQEDVLTGRAIESVATAVLYAACEEKNVSRDLTELAAVSHSDYPEVADTYTRLVKDLGLNDYGVEVTTHVPALCNALDLDEDVQTIASDILRNTLTEELMEDASLMEHTAAAVYAASVRAREKTSQHRIAAVANIETSAIRARYQEQLEAASFNAAY